MTTTTNIEERILQTDASGAPVRLEYVRGRMKGEASPASRHQKTVRRIERSIHPRPDGATSCACYAPADTLIRFPAPDHEALDILPVAVIEILSLGYEDKDLGEDGAPFYLACGVVNVLVVDPRTGMVRHYRAGEQVVELQAPITIDLACGCQVQV